jgi:hypothetical protein
MQTASIWRTDYTYLDKEPLAVMLNIEQTEEPRVSAFQGPSAADSIFDQQNSKAVGSNARMVRNPRYW